MESSEVKVFQNLYDDVLHFESKEEFNRYYNKNKEAIDKMATRGMNVKFKIEGFKIGRQKGNIILYPTKDSKQTQTNNEELTDETGLNLHQKLNQIQIGIKNILEAIDDLFEEISLLKNEQSKPKPQPPQTYNQQLSKSIQTQRFSTFGI